MRILLIVMAVVIAISATVMTSYYLKNPRQKQQASVEATEVLVSAVDLEIGQTVSERNLQWQLWPKKNINSKYIVRKNHPDAIKKFAGTTVRQPLVIGEPVTEAKLVKRDGSSVLSVLLQEGYRAVTIKVDEAQGLAGLVRPGDLVDVILTQRVNTPDAAGSRSERTISKIVARGARILAMGQEISKEAEKSKMVKSITIEVTPQQAEAVSVGRTIGTLSLALRSLASEGKENISEETGDVSVPFESASIKFLSVKKNLEPNSLLNQADLTWISIPRNQKHTDQYIPEEGHNPKTFHGSLLTAAGVPGQPLLRKDIVKPSDGRFVPLALRPGFRAISVTIAKNTAVGGFISPGDLVDIIYTDEVTDENASSGLKQRSWSETVANGIRVLAIETGLDPRTQLPTVGGTATLEATPEQARKIALAAAMGQITLALRSISEQIPSAHIPEGNIPSGKDGVFTADTEMSQGLKKLTRPEVVGTKSRNSTGVIVIRGSSSKNSK